jgi:hypothetical protein
MHPLGSEGACQAANAATQTPSPARAGRRAGQHPGTQAEGRTAGPDEAYPAGPVPRRQAIPVPETQARHDQPGYSAAMRYLCLALALSALVLAPAATAGPAYCYSTRPWQPFPRSQGYCPDGQSPFDGSGPSYGGGNHRWPSGDDE